MSFILCLPIVYGIISYYKARYECRCPACNWGETEYCFKDDPHFVKVLGKYILITKASKLCINGEKKP